MHWLLFVLRFFLNRLDRNDQNTVGLAARIDGGLLQVRRPTSFWENSVQNLRGYSLAVWRWLRRPSKLEGPHNIQRSIAKKRNSARNCV